MSWLPQAVRTMAAWDNVLFFYAFSLLSLITVQVLHLGRVHLCPHGCSSGCSSLVVALVVPCSRGGNLVATLVLVVVLLVVIETRRFKLWFSVVPMQLSFHTCVQTFSSMCVSTFWLFSLSAEGFVNPPRAFFAVDHIAYNQWGGSVTSYIPLFRSLYWLQTTVSIPMFTTLVPSRYPSVNYRCTVSIPLLIKPCTVTPNASIAFSPLC